MSGWLVQSGVAEKWEKVQTGTANGNVPAAEYADAAMAIISVFDLISGMGIAKSDMNGNAKAIAKFAELNPGKSLQALCDAELATGDVKKLIKGGTACCALLWLQRALIFIKVLLETLEQERAAKLSECVNKGYEASLKKFHGFAVRTTFSLAVKAAPARDGFMMKLASTEEEVFTRIGAMMPVVNEILSINDGYLRAKGIETA